MKNNQNQENLLIRLVHPQSKQHKPNLIRQIQHITEHQQEKVK